MKRMNTLKTLTALVMAALTACSQPMTGIGGESESANQSPNDSLTQNTVITESAIASTFEDEDYSFAGFDESEAVSIIFDGSAAKTEEKSVIVNGADVTITQKGTYLIEGNTDDGSIMVNVESGKVKLLLNGVSISKDGAPAINVISAKSVTLTLMDGTVNTFSDSGTYTYADGEDEPDAAVFSKDDLIINGSGSMSVTSPVKNGIKSKDTLIIAADTGNITVDAQYNGISGKDYLTIYGGNINVTAGNHGLRSTEADDATLGYVRIVDGNITVNAGDTAINGENEVYIEGGNFTIIAAEGSGNASVNASQNTGMGFGGMGGGGRWQNGENTQNVQNGESIQPNNRQNGAFPTRPQPGTAMPEREASFAESDENAASQNSGGNMIQRPGGRGGFGEMRPTEQTDAAGEQSKEQMPGIPQNMPEGSFEAMPGSAGQRPGRGFTPEQAPDGSQLPEISQTPENASIPTFPEWDAEPGDGEADQSDSVGKGIKAENLITILGGTFNLDTADDAIHTNNSVKILGGNFEIKCGDDAIHGDKTLTVANADITVATCYEGLESELITIDSGSIEIFATDDAINSASAESEATGGFGGGRGGMGMARDGVETIINGGVIKISAGFDGIDTNGNFTINGGEVYISCRGNGGDGAIDPDGTVYINGGKVLAIGPSGMANRAQVSDGMTYTVVNLGTQIAAQKSISVTDAFGNSLMSASFDKSASSVIVITDALAEGDELNIVTEDGEIGSFTATKTPTGNFGGFGGMGGRGQRNGGMTVSEAQAE